MLLQLLRLKGGGEALQPLRLHNLPLSCQQQQLVVRKSHISIHHRTPDFLSAHCVVVGAACRAAECAQCCPGLGCGAHRNQQHIHWQLPAGTSPAPLPQHNPVTLSAMQWPCTGACTAWKSACVLLVLVHAVGCHQWNGNYQACRSALGTPMVIMYVLVGFAGAAVQPAAPTRQPTSPGRCPRRGLGATTLGSGGAGSCG
jgi:hypothetical protein